MFPYLNNNKSPIFYFSDITQKFIKKTNRFSLRSFVKSVPGQKLVLLNYVIIGQLELSNVLDNSLLCNIIP